MPKFTVTARNYPLTLLLGGILFALTLFLTAQSIGKVGISGGDDEGSGLGGTGKSGEFGGSGLGGTGITSPFLGINEDLERAKQELEQAKEELRPLDTPESVDRMIRLETLREEATAIAEAPIIQTPSSGSSAGQADLNRLQDPALGPGSGVRGPVFELSLPNPVVSPSELANSLNIDLEAAQDTDKELAGELAKEEQTVAPQLASEAPAPEPAVQPQQMTVDQAGPDAVTEPAAPTELADVSSDEPETGEMTSEQEASERLQVPDRIQRPELPPFQRMRPAIDRSAIMPSRPQPMRI